MTMYELLGKLFPTMKPLNGVKDENGVSSEAVEAPKAEPEKIDFCRDRAFIQRFRGF